MGESLTENIFEIHYRINQFNLSQQEMSVLVPFLLSVSMIQSNEEIIPLNEMYKRALLHEISLRDRRGSERSVEYLENVSSFFLFIIYNTD